LHNGTISSSIVSGRLRTSLKPPRHQALSLLFVCACYSLTVSLFKYVYVEAVGDFDPLSFVYEVAIAYPTVDLVSLITVIESLNTESDRR